MLYYIPQDFWGEEKSCTRWLVGMCWTQVRDDEAWFLSLVKKFVEYKQLLSSPPLRKNQQAFFLKKIIIYILYWEVDTVVAMLEGGVCRPLVFAPGSIYAVYWLDHLSPFQSVHRWRYPPKITRKKFFFSKRKDRLNGEPSALTGFPVFALLKNIFIKEDMFF